MKPGVKDGGSFDQGIEQVVAAVLASPDFLYRAIRGPKGTSPNTEFALTDLELASRLSFFLWNTGPDEELLKLAAAGGLTKPGAMETQVKRMLADPKASSLVTSFAMKWLNLDASRFRASPTRSCSRDSTINCGAIFRRKRKLSSAASFWKTGAWWIC